MQKLHKFIGWFGSALLGFCGLPEVIRTISDGTCHVGWGFLGMWGIGELLLFLYVLPKKDSPLLVNYLFNIILIGIMVWYKI